MILLAYRFIFLSEHTLRLAVISIQSSDLSTKKNYNWVTLIDIGQSKEMFGECTNIIGEQIKIPAEREKTALNRILLYKQAVIRVENR